MLVVFAFLCMWIFSPGTAATSLSCNTTAELDCATATQCYEENKCNKYCSSLCCTGDCEVEVAYYCGGTFNISLGDQLDGGCGNGASRSCAVSSDACETYWRNANYRSCDKCCPDVNRWNGKEWEPVIDRDATCYNLVKAMAEGCKTPETEKKWKDVTKACGGASAMKLAKSVAAVTAALLIYLIQ